MMTTRSADRNSMSTLSAARVSWASFGIRCLSLAALTLGILESSLGAAEASRTIKAQPSRSWAVTYLGSWHVAAHPEYGKAVYALGEPTSVQNPDVPSCVARWASL